MRGAPVDRRLAPNRLLGILLVLLVSMAGARAAERWQPTDGWRSAGGVDHPLVGTVFDTRTGRATGVEDLRRRIDATPVVLLGEVHDNGDHHALRAMLLGGRRALVFEHLRPDQAPVLDALAADRAAGRPVPSADDLLSRLGWETSGWPPASLFRPLFDRALGEGMAILPGDADRVRMREVARGGAAAIPPEDTALLALDRPLGNALQQALLDELEASHCGLMPRTAFGGMAVAQRYRDAVLADTLLAAHDRHGPVALLAGNGHVRADRGVPWYLDARRPGLASLAVEFVEVQRETDAAAYITRGPDGRPVADVLVFTPKALREDPCIAMRKAFTKRQ